MTDEAMSPLRRRMIEDMSTIMNGPPDLCPTRFPTRSRPIAGICPKGL